MRMIAVLVSLAALLVVVTYRVWLKISWVKDKVGMTVHSYGYDTMSTMTCDKSQLTVIVCHKKV